MKFPFALITLFVALSLPAFSQGTGCLTQDSSAVLIDAFKVDLTLTGNDQQSSTVDAPIIPEDRPPEMKASGKGGIGSGHVIVDVSVWNVQGRPVIAISNGTVDFKGDPVAVEKMSASEIFAMLTQAAIGQGLGRKSLSCTAECGGYLVEVVQPACVSREMTESGMVLKTCNLSDCCVKTYMVCCPTGSASPVIKEVSSKGSGCTSSGCESTCQ